MTGLEPTTFWSITRRATKLRYTSLTALLLYFNLKKKQTIFGVFRKNFLFFCIIIYALIFTNDSLYYIIVLCGVGNWFYRCS